MLALLVSGVGGVLGAVLDGDDGPSASNAGSRPSAAAPTSPSPEPIASAAPALSSAVVAATGADRTAVDARAALEEQLTARAGANLALLRSTWAGEQDAARTAARAVTASSNGLSAVLTTWRDADLGDQVRAGLDAQSDASRAYAAGIGSGDLAAADEARARMGEVSRDLGALLDGLTDGRIADYVPPQDAAQYRAFVDALETEDAAAAERAAAWLRGRLSREGTALAAALTEGGPA